MDRQRAPTDLVRGVVTVDEVALGPPAGHGPRPAHATLNLRMENQLRDLGDGGGRPLLQIHGQREWQKHAATVRDGQRFHRATAAAVTMDREAGSWRRRTGPRRGKAWQRRMDIEIGQEGLRVSFYTRKDLGL